MPYEGRGRKNVKCSISITSYFLFAKHLGSPLGQEIVKLLGKNICILLTVSLVDGKLRGGRNYFR